MPLYDRHEDDNAITYTISPGNDPHISTVKVYKDTTGHYEVNFCPCRDARSWQEITDAIEAEASGLWVNV